MSYLLENNTLSKDVKEVNLSGIVRQSIADLYNDYSAIQLTFELPEQDVVYRGDASLLTRAINNILLNSLKHNESPSIRLSLSETKSEILLKITDDGCISQPQVIELDQKTHHYDVHGMGVIISQQIVALHHGHMEFEFLNPGLEVRFRFKKGISVNDSCK